MVDCSEELRLLREARRLTQLQVANKVGVSKATISAYETASKAPSLEVIVRLARFYGVSVDYLVRVDAPKMLDVSKLDDATVALLAALVDKMRPAEE